MVLIVDSPVVKRLNTYDLRELGNISKVSKIHRMPPLSPGQMERFVNISRKLLKN